MLKRVSTVLTVLAVLLVSAFVVNKVTAVTLDDITNHFSLGRAQAQVGVSGGDIYAISPDGLTETKICALDLQEDFVTRVDIDAKFTNAIGETLPFLVKWVSFGAEEGLGDGAELDGARVRFSGQFTELQSNAPGAASPDCERRMARFASRRHMICMVRSSLIPSQNQVFSAYRFDAFQIFLPETIFEAHGMVKTDAVREIETKTCPNSSAVPWDVAFRKSLRVITMETVSEI